MRGGGARSPQTNVSLSPIAAAAQVGRRVRGRVAQAQREHGRPVLRDRVEPADSGARQVLGGGGGARGRVRRSDGGRERRERRVDAKDGVRGQVGGRRVRDRAAVLHVFRGDPPGGTGGGEGESRERAHTLARRVTPCVTPTQVDNPPSTSHIAWGVLKKTTCEAGIYSLEYFGNACCIGSVG